MKSKFDWCTPLSDDEYDDIWKDGVLVLDTNVLLDLYKYHSGTSEEILQAIREFPGKKWLPYQVAEEFFRNRAGVIASIETEFEKAIKEVTDAQKRIQQAVIQLKSIRILPTNICDQLGMEAEQVFAKTKESIQAANAIHPRFRERDPILDELLNIFEGAVGNDFSDDDARKKASIEGDRRRKEGIPPGILDGHKDGGKANGDYFLWMQTLEHAKKVGKPIIFVTSEQKDDWWDSRSGKTIGPRFELAQEAAKVSGQRVLFYKTENFIRRSSSRRSMQITAQVLDDIQRLELQRYTEKAKEMASLLQPRQESPDFLLPSQEHNFPFNGHPGLPLQLQRDPRRSMDIGFQQILEGIPIQVTSETPHNGKLSLLLNAPAESFKAVGYIPPFLGNREFDVLLDLAPKGCPPFSSAHSLINGSVFMIEMASNEKSRPFPAGIYAFSYWTNNEIRSDGIPSISS